MNTNTQTCAHTHKHTHTHTHARTHVHTHTRMHTRTHVHTHTHACTHMHSRMHAHTHTLCPTIEHGSLCKSWGRSLPLRGSTQQSWKPTSVMRISRCVCTPEECFEVEGARHSFDNTNQTRYLISRHSSSMCGIDSLSTLGMVQCSLSPAHQNGCVYQWYSIEPVVFSL